VAAPRDFVTAPRGAMTAPRAAGVAERCAVSAPGSAAADFDLAGSQRRRAEGYERGREADVPPAAFL
jgi:hypothetical protein